MGLGICVRSGRPRSALLFKTHIWPLSEKSLTRDGINLSSSLERYFDAVNKYNEDNDRKYDLDLVISFETTGAEGLYPTRYYPEDLNVHFYGMHSVEHHGFIHSRHKDLSPNIKSFLKNCPIDEPSRDLPHPKETQEFNPAPMWFNPEYGLLDFYQTCSEAYDVYWMFEYDVWVKGDLYEYLKLHDSSCSDFMCYGISRDNLKHRNTLWGYSDEIGMKSYTVGEPSPSIGYWGGVGNFSAEIIYGGYFPVTRYTKAAVKSLWTGYSKDRICGFCEVLVPTYLATKGLSISTFNATNSTNTESCYLVHKLDEVLGRVKDYDSLFRKI